MTTEEARAYIAQLTEAEVEKAILLLFRKLPHQEKLNFVAKVKAMCIKDAKAEVSVWVS